jgi:glycerophosphoryl diester phosphodiesterase
MSTGPKIIAHRGNTHQAPENTLCAVREAILRGAEGIEIDLRRTRDHKVVVCHDASPARLTCREKGNRTEKAICLTDWEELKDLTIPYANHLMLPYEDCPEDEREMLALMERIQTDREPGYSFADAFAREHREESFVLLSELFGELKRLDWHGIVELELKDKGLTSPLDEVLRNCGYEGEIYIMSGDPEIIDETQDFYASRPKPPSTGLAANIRRLDKAWRSRIPEMDLAEVGLNADCFTKDDVSWLSDEGIAVFSNLGDRHDWWEQMQKWSVAGFKTNYMERYIRWRKEEYEKI